MVTYLYLKGELKSAPGVPLVRVIEFVLDTGGFISNDYPAEAFNEQFLTCRKCMMRCISKVMGANDFTSFTCKYCNGLGIPEGAELERLGFDDFSMSAEPSLESLMEIETTASGKRRRYDPGRGLAQFNYQHYRDYLSNSLRRIIVKPPSSRILKARLRGEPWLKKADAAALDKLPDKQRQALIAFWWGGLKAKEIADFMSVPERTVEYYLLEAKKNISQMVSVT
jgi:hypothetical protein